MIIIHYVWLYYLHVIDEIYVSKQQFRYLFRIYRMKIGSTGLNKQFSK